MAEMVVPMEVKLAAVLARLATGERMNVTTVCANLAIARSTFYKYQVRFVAYGVEGLLPRSRRPASCPWQTPVAVEDMIVRLRKELAEDGSYDGAISIRYAMLDAGEKPPSTATINRVLRRRGLVVDAPAKRPRSAMRRFEFSRGNACWQIDAFEWILADGVKVAVLQIIDDHSRLEVDSYAADSETCEAAWACWMRAVTRHGVPAMLLSDNGLAFSGARRDRTVAFERNVRALGTATITSSSGHPQTCGKDERAHQTMQRWLRARPAATSLVQLQAQLDTYRSFYNQRHHQGIDGQRPADRYATAQLAQPTGQPAPTDTKITYALVSATGKAAVDGHIVAVGTRWARARVHVIRQGDQVTMLHGLDLVIELTLDRSRRYQPSGAKPGGPLHRRVLSTMS